MEKQNKPSVKFNNCENIGQQIRALVLEIMDQPTLGKYILERALEDVTKLEKEQKKVLSDYEQKAEKEGY